MKRFGKRLAFFSFVIAAGMAAACAPSASDEEIRQMCDHLATLRGAAKNETMKQQCIAEAQREKISQRQARCRIAAINTQEYWNRCRTGKAQ